MASRDGLRGGLQSLTDAERGVPVSNNARCAVVKMRHCNQSFKKKGQGESLPFG
jgi:hypothetical protein